jgi:hypothetical protein
VWRARYPELSEAIQAGNDVFNPRVERALAESAIGYWVTWEEEEFVNGKLVTVTQKKEYFAPDVRAQQFWMKIRMKDRWSDVKKHEVKPQYKSSAELLEDMRQQIVELQAEGYLEGLVVPHRPIGKSKVNLVPRMSQDRSNNDYHCDYQQ